LSGGGLSKLMRARTQRTITGLPLLRCSLSPCPGRPPAPDPPTSAEDRQHSRQRLRALRGRARPSRHRAGDDGPDFIAALESVMPLRDLWWILLTHDDADHIGSLRRLIELAPQARGDPRAGRPSDEYMVAAAAEPRPCRGAGGSAPRHDRSLVAIRPPVFDKPTTTGIYDECTGRLFSLDSLGAILSELTRHLLESALSTTWIPGRGASAATDPRALLSPAVRQRQHRQLPGDPALAPGCRALRRSGPPGVRRPRQAAGASGCGLMWRPGDHDGL
jgi:hypothetical protein